MRLKDAGNIGFVVGAVMVALTLPVQAQVPDATPRAKGLGPDVINLSAHPQLPELRSKSASTTSGVGDSATLQPAVRGTLPHLPEVRQPPTKQPTSRERAPGPAGDSIRVVVNPPAPKREGSGIDDDGRDAGA